MGSTGGRKWTFGDSCNQEKFTVATPGLEDVYFTWRLLSNTESCAKVINKLREHVTANFQEQAIVTATAVEDLNAPAFTKTNLPVCMHWALD